MNYFRRQDNARTQTRRLVLALVLATTCIIGAAYPVVAAIVAHFTPGTDPLWNPRLFLGTTAAISLIILSGSLIKMQELRGGGASLALTLGGSPIDPARCSDPERMLLNIVEEMSIASGIPTPEVYLLHHENSINAFAAGTSPTQAVIGITRGALHHLERDELQGVVAHEIAHIINNDVAINLRLIGLLHGILALSILGRILFETTRISISTSRRKRGGNNPLPLLGLALMAVGWTGALAARWIKSAINREREFLADAAAVQFTRNPDGLAGALIKIGGLPTTNTIASPHAEEASHLFFTSATRSWWLSSLATHPPLTDRIRALNPAFDGCFPPLTPLPPIPPDADTPGDTHRARPIPNTPSSTTPTGTLSVHEAVASITTPGYLPVLEQLALPAHLPATLVNAAHRPEGAAAIVVWLACHGENGTGNGTDGPQTETPLPPAILDELHAAAPPLRSIDKPARMALASIAMPALQRLSPQQQAELHGTVDRLTSRDGTLDLFEFMLLKVLRRQLAHSPQFPAVASNRLYSLLPLTSACTTLLSALAHVGTNDPAEVQHHFSTGVERIKPRLGAKTMELLPIEDCGLEPIDTALDEIRQAVPALRYLVLEACASTVAADATLSSGEFCLIQAIAAALDCPLPALLQQLPTETAADTHPSGSRIT